MKMVCKEHEPIARRLEERQRFDKMFISTRNRNSYCSGKRKDVAKAVERIKARGCILSSVAYPCRVCSFLRHGHMKYVIDDPELKGIR